MAKVKYFRTNIDHFEPLKYDYKKGFVTVPLWDSDFLRHRASGYILDDSMLIDNQRFKKLCRLPQLGVYVDEAHHLFGANLEKELRSGTANKTTLRNTINELNKKVM